MAKEKKDAWHLWLRFWEALDFSGKALVVIVGEGSTAAGRHGDTPLPEKRLGTVGWKTDRKTMLPQEGGVPVSQTLQDKGSLGAICVYRVIPVNLGLLTSPGTGW